MSERMAGRELDAEIAERVLGATGRTVLYAWHDRKARANPVIAFVGQKGWSSTLNSDYGTWVDAAANKVNHDVRLPKNYSEDIASAFLAVEAMRPLYHVEIHDCLSSWAVRFLKYSGYPSDLARVQDSSLPLAICLAALAALAAVSQSPDTTGEAQ